jgi:hypothetical protein
MVYVFVRISNLNGNRFILIRGSGLCWFISGSVAETMIFHRHMTLDLRRAREADRPGR